MGKIVVSLFTFLLLVNIAKASPVISFFNEQQTPALVKLFQDSSLIPALQQLHAEIRMGILDLTPERAAIVRRLNQAGITVVAWLLLPEEEGYSLNSGNGARAIERYIAIKKWAADNQLVFKGIGIELEFDDKNTKLIMGNTWKWIRGIPGRLYKKSVLEDGREQYAKLTRMIKEDGYFSETYYVPFIKDEAAENRTSLQLVTGLPDIRADREIPMLYSSYFGLGDGLIQVYGFNANAKFVALGSTEAGTDTTYIKSGILEYEELVRDMNLAAKKMEEIHIYNLEGCVQNGYLRKLLDYRYDSSLFINQDEVNDIKEIRDKFSTLSKVLSYPTLILIGIAIVLALISWFLIILVRKLIAFIS